jgi:hypothetical protein
MRSLTYTDSGYAARGAGTGRVKPTAPWRRAYAAIMRSQQRRAEREIAAYLGSHGGLLTDDMEREIMHRLQGRHRSSL